MYVAHTGWNIHKSVILLIQIVQLDPSKNLDIENTLWAPNQSGLYQLVE